MRPLTVCGPGGPYAPIRDCAKAFAQSRGGPVEVLKSEPSLWRSYWENGVDVFSGGAPSMLDDFHRQNPDILDLSTLQDLWSREIGILVRSGNPLRIASLIDLGRFEAQILDVQMEQMGAFQKEGYFGKPIITLSVLTGEQGRQAWMSKPELDAWITYRTWHATLKDGTEFVPLGPAGATRSAVAALTRTARREAATAFVTYLKSEEAHAVFRQYGWI